MCLQHNQASGVAFVSNDTITIDFYNMPLRQLLAMRRLGEGTSAKSCTSWDEAASSAAKALLGYLDSGLDPVVTVRDLMIQIVVNVPDGGAAIILPDVKNFFRRENISVEKSSGVRGLASA